MKKMFYLFIAILIAGSAFAQNAKVEFRVNMTVQAKEGKFVPGTDAVKLAGNFNGWNNGVNEMLDEDGDSIYSVVIDTFAVNDTLFFKFIKGTESWEADPNREYVVPSDSSVFTGWFDRDSIYDANTASIAITFSCNMEFEIVSGRFNPSTDTLTVRGSFNGWSGDDMLTQSAVDPNYYEKTVDYVTTVGEVINYKYAYINSLGIQWEGDPNKTYEITQEDFDSETAYIERTYNNLTLDNVTNNEVTIKFVVNMNDATNAEGQSFPSIENVFIAGAVAPLQWPDGGWPNEDSTIVHFLYNDGTNGDEVADDSLWSIDLTFPQYSPLRIQYKYGANWGLASNLGSNDNEAASGSDHFINLTPELVTATVRNQFGVTGDHDIIITDIKELPNLQPVTYSLSQNFPNPFNPVTNIRFAIPEAGLVTMKIYNVIGQEVATLLNEYKNAGTYNVDFNALNLTSGVYFYTIKAGKFSETKKMILMK